MQHQIPFLLPALQLLNISRYLSLDANIFAICISVSGLNKLKYLKVTKNPEFNEKLNQFIFNYLTLSTEYYNYEQKYKHIIDVCKQNGFEIPEAFIDLDIEEKFNKVFFSL